MPETADFLRSAAASFQIAENKLKEAEDSLNEVMVRLEETLGNLDELRFAGPAAYEPDLLLHESRAAHAGEMRPVRL